ncbi:hypothetical protein [Granulicella sp. dw_53]|uniref:hypothetical protein n=1 Tax=Granulicella sp. dw_53 TaxID=2719792 RepID=UPI0031F6DD4E
MATKLAAVLRLELFTLKNRSVFPQPIWSQSSWSSQFCARALSGLLLAIVTLTLTSCSQNLYKFPQFTFANRPIPPSLLANRVMVGVTANGTSTGSLAILDGNRDIRSNIQNTIKSFAISGFSGGYPDQIFNFPEQITGYVLSDSDGSLTKINYGTEASTGAVGTFVAKATSIGISESFARIVAGLQNQSEIEVLDNATGSTFFLQLPNVQNIAINQGGTVILATVRNSNLLYRILKLNINAPFPPGYIDCQPLNLPVYCVVPVPGNYDRPTTAYFSVDGTTAYVLNCGPECGGATASVSALQQGLLTIDVIPTSTPYPSPVTATIPVPGGATTAVSDGTTLYVAGQQLLPDGLFAGNLSTIALASNSVTGKYSISDGNHSKILFADDNTLWIGSQFCATGERAKLGQNYNCLTRFDLGAKVASIIPNVTPGSPTATVPFPNTDNNPYYYGSLTGLCWVQNLHKVYTAYGGQVHAFMTADGSEINNSNITVQGTALDVAYMDAITNAAN